MPAEAGGRHRNHPVEGPSTPLDRGPRFTDDGCPHPTPFIPRDATWACEMADTWDTMEFTKAAVLDIEILNGFSVLASDVVRGLRRI